MFKDLGVKAVMSADPEYASQMHENNLRARDFVVDQAKRGVPVSEIIPQMRLKYDPLVGENAKPPKNNYFQTIPDDPAQVSDAFQRLYQVDARTLDKKDWQRQVMALKSLFDLSTKKQSLKSQLGVK